MPENLAELQLLKYAITWPETVAYVPHVEGRYFSDSNGWRIWDAIKGMVMDGRDVTFARIAEVTGLDAALSSIVASSASEAPDPKRVAAYGRDVTKAYQARRLSDLLFEYSQSTDDPDDIAERLTHEMTELVAGEQIFHSAADAVDDTIKQIAGKPRMLKTGIGPIDDILGGMMSGWLTLLAADTNVGKMAMAVNICDNIASRGQRVVYFSLEDTRQMMVNRMLCRRVDCDLRRLNEGNVRLTDAMRRGYMLIKQLPLTIIDDWFDDIEALTLAILRADLVLNPDCYAVDYLQLIEAYGRDDVERTKAIAIRLKKVFKRIDKPCLAISQYRKTGRTDIYTPPTLADIPGSGATMQTASAAILLHPVSKDTENRHKMAINANVAKNKSGAKGECILDFWKRQVSFSEQGKEQWVYV